MSARRPVYVKVAKIYMEWLGVSAVTLDDAKDEATEMDGVAFVMQAQYEKPEESQ